MLTHYTCHDKFEIKPRLGLFFVFCTLFFNSFKLDCQNEKFTVVLDAGHGGSDPGNTGNGYQEKNIALKVVKEIGKELSSVDGMKIIYTRREDVLIDLWKRGEIANKAKADLFVSVHCDAHHSNAFGSSTFVLGLHANKRNFEVAKRENAVISLEQDFKEKYQGFDPDSEESVLGINLMQEENLDKSFSLAADIQENFTKSAKRKNRGVKQAGFVVLHQTYMPSVLVELGFLTNKKEGKFLNSKVGQQQMARELAKSIKKYYHQTKLNTVSVTYQSPDGEKKNSTLSHASNKQEITFRIQIASSKNKIDLKTYNFKGLKNVQRVKMDTYYKYYSGMTKTYQEAKIHLLEVKNKGYSDAYIVAFKNGVKVPLSEVLK